MSSKSDIGHYFEWRKVDPEYYKQYKLHRYYQAVLPQDKAAAILDVGCGFGQVLNAFKSLGYSNLTGADIDPLVLEEVAKNGIRTLHMEDVKKYAASASEKFDFITMSHVLEHIPKEEVIDTLKAIKSLLKPKGTFFVIVPNGQAATDAYWHYEDFTHHTLYTSGSLYYVLRAAGFDEVDFIDPRGTYGMNPLYKLIFGSLQWLYRLNKKFWNLVNLAYYHKPSPIIYTFELKALASCKK